VHGLGADHVIFQQRWKRRRVHRAYVTVHIGAKDRRVYLVKSRAAPRDVLRSAPDDRIGEARAARTALARVRRRSRTRGVGRPELLWYPAKRQLHPAWRVRVHRTAPRAEYIIYVSAETGSVIHVYDNLAALTGHGRVFLPNPMARDRRFEPLDEEGEMQHPTAGSYVDVSLTGLRGNGRLDGTRATTRLTRRRLRKRNHDFRVNWNRVGFEEVSAYYHVHCAIAYLESLGYQGSRRIFTSPLEINARGAPEDDSWYSPGERTLTFGLGDVDDAEDGETVLREFGPRTAGRHLPGLRPVARGRRHGRGLRRLPCRKLLRAREARALQTRGDVLGRGAIRGRPPVRPPARFSSHLRDV
jgi:hypothetical protein